MYLKQLLHTLTLRQKSLSTIIRIPDEHIEKNKTLLSKIFILNPSGKIFQSDDTYSRLFDILYSINHYECSEFNKLLDILTYIGVDIFDHCWHRFGAKLRKMIHSVVTEKDENNITESALFPNVLASVAKSGSY
jgi:hypothetical protein